MFSIGDFARFGRVSVRMLRHYDAIGLLRPADVDPSSGYRFYRADQLGRLNRVIALKDLGFTLEQVRGILDGQVDAAELRGMLRLRRAQLAARLTADETRLAGVEARLHMIEVEGRMPAEDVVVKDLPAVRVAELSDTADSWEGEAIGPVIQPLYPELFRRLDKAGVSPIGPGIAYYEPADGGSGDAVVVHAAVPVSVEPHPAFDFAVVDLPAVPQAATLIHRGSMDDVEGSMQVLARWLEDHGYRGQGYAREVYLDYCQEDTGKGVTEVQIALVRE